MLEDFRTNVLKLPILAAFQPRPQGFSLKNREKPWERGWQLCREMRALKAREASPAHSLHSSQLLCQNFAHANDLAGYAG